jgi:hypothetical protein
MTGTTIALFILAALAAAQTPASRETTGARTLPISPNISQKAIARRPIWSTAPSRCFSRAIRPISPSFIRGPPSTTKSTPLKKVFLT